MDQKTSALLVFEILVVWVVSCDASQRRPRYATRKQAAVCYSRIGCGGSADKLGSHFHRIHVMRDMRPKASFWEK
jgi:hypothetical protein